MSTFRFGSALTLSDHEFVVRPTERIVDFRTEHSGIRPADIMNGTLIYGAASTRVLLERACSTTLSPLLQHPLWRKFSQR